MIEYDYDANEITLLPADFVRLYAAPEKEQPKRPERLTRALMRCCQHGQGNRRTVMAEAFSRALKAQGYVCGMYYQMD